MSGRNGKAEFRSDAVQLLGLFGGFLVFSLLSIGLSRLGIDVAGLWLANVFAIGACLRWRPAHPVAVAAAVAIASIAGNWIGGSSFEASSLFAAGNIVHVGISLLLARRLVGPLPLNAIGLADFAKLIGLVGGIATIVAALCFALMAAAFMGWPFAATAERWFSANALGVALLLPLILLASHEAWRVLLSPRAIARVAFVGTAGAAGVWLALSWGQFGFVLAMLPLLVASPRLPVFELAIVSALTGTSAIAMALTGNVPGLDSGIGAFSQGFQVALALTMLMPLFGALLIRQILDDRARISESEQKFRRAIQDAAIGVAIVGLDDRMIEVNTSFADMLGYGRGEMEGRLFSDFTLPEDAEAGAETMRNVRAGALRSYHVEKRYLHRDGTPIWSDVAASVILDEETGKPLYLVSQIVNIDARKRSAAMVAEAETRWDFALASAGQGMWDLDMRSGHVTYSATWKAMLGYDEAELDGDPDRWLTLVHPDDIAQVVEADRVHQTGASDMFEAEFRMRHKDGHWIWILDRGRAVSRMPDGRIQRAIGTLTDITARKESESHLAETAAMLAAEKERLRVTLQSIGDAVICTDADHCITFMNPVAEALLGVDVEAALGRALAEFYLSVDEDSGEVLALGASGRPADGRAVLVKPDGSRCGIRETISPIVAAGGEINGFVIVFQDVTDARAMQRELSYAASHDALTGLANRSSFVATMERLLESAGASDEHQLLYIDLDRFKLVNDSGGHAAGDELLKRVSVAIRSAVRDQDFVARIGGDEFAAVLRVCPAPVGMIIAQNLVSAIADLSFEWDGTSYAIGASVGVAPIRPGMDLADDIIARADRACYAAKSSGRGRAVAAVEEVDLGSVSAAS